MSGGTDDTRDEPIQAAPADRGADRGVAGASPEEGARPESTGAEEARGERSAAGAREEAGDPHSGPSSRRAWMVGRALGVVRPLLIDKVERDHRQSDAQFLRRRIVVAITIIVGATLLGLSFSTEQGDPRFYPLTLGLAATWVIGSFTSGPLHLGRILARGELRRPILAPILVGLCLAALFIVGALIFRMIPPLAGLTEDVLGYARSGNLAIITVITLVNGIAEELFFRGALFAAIGVRYPVLISTLLYGLATVPGGNPVLVFAALILGLVVGLQRRAGGGVLAPILTHITWSMTMLYVLPPIFAA
jgi:membrane protease YdiL (CAAX protease family)